MEALDAERTRVATRPARTPSRPAPEPGQKTSGAGPAHSFGSISLQRLARSAATSSGGVGAPPSPHTLIALQGSAGNAAVGGLVIQRCACGSSGGSCGCGSHESRPSASLEISQPDDPLEREAEAVADAVVARSPLPGVSSGAATISRCAGNPGCGCVHEDEDEASTAFRSPADGGAPGYAGHELEREAAAPSGGTALESGTRARMEASFGTSFGGVRVHADSRAARLSRSVSAEAFTVGSDIYFGAGRYRPGTAEGDHLIAHELTHTLQQSPGGARRRIQRRILVNDPTTPRVGGEQWGVTVIRLFNQLCPGITWTLTGGNVVTPAQDACLPAAVALTSTPTACSCVCSFVTGTRDITIHHSPTGNNTVGNDIRITGAASTVEGVFRGSDPPAGGSSVQSLPDPPFIVLGHELCGHALTTQNPAPGTSPNHEMTQGWDTSAVDIENRIRREHQLLSGTDFGIRMGSFEDVDGNIHMGSVIRLPAPMRLLDVMTALNVPINHHAPVCTVIGEPLVYLNCPGTPRTGLQWVRMLERVIWWHNGGYHIPYRCLWSSFPAGFDLAIEGIFWHRTIAGETKQSIAGRWAIDIARLDVANRIFSPGLALISPTTPLPADVTVIIPYKWAPGATRYFLVTRGPRTCEH